MIHPVELVDRFGSLFGAFEEAVFDEKTLTDEGIKGKWVKEFVEVAKENIQPPFVNIDGFFEITLPVSDGIVHIREVLTQAEKNKNADVSVQYVGAPRYRLVVKAPDYKTAEDEMNRAVEQVVNDIISVGGASVALFWLGLMLIYVFYYKLGLVPDPMGRLAPLMEAPPGPTGMLVIDTLVHGDFEKFRSAVGHLILPTVSLAIVLTPTIAKMARAAMLEVLQSDYIQTARAIGLSTGRLIWHDALPNAMIPILTTMGIVMAYLMAGNVLVEMLFSWPGIGFYAWSALMSNDFDAIQGFVLLIAVFYVFINLIIDLLYSLIDPRIRLG